MSSSNSLVRGAHAIERHLLSRADAAEVSRSSYWDEQVPKFTLDDASELAGFCAVGTISHKMSLFHSIAHWLLQTPWRLIGRRYRHFAEFEALGRVIAGRQERQFTEDMMRQVLAVSLAADHLELSDPAAASCVIGDGYGVLSSLLWLRFKPRKVIVVNLRKTLAIDIVFLAKAAPEARIALARTMDEMAAAFTDQAVDVIAVEADNASALMGAPIGIAFNACSMQEMDPAIIADYFRYLRSAHGAATALYCCNRIEKTLPDGTITRFFDYPWDKGDRILLDEICPWLNLAYSSRPPFWQRKPDVIACQHRLAYLEKTRSPAL